MATIYEVAAQAGVSPATVSRVLNGNAAVKDALVARVRSAVAELNYRPNQVARSMRTQRTGIVAAVVPDVIDPFFAALVRGAEDAARETGTMLALCNTDDHHDVETRYLALAADQQMDGIILSSAAGARSGEHLPRGVPVVLVARLLPGVEADSVLIEPVDASPASRRSANGAPAELAREVGRAAMRLLQARLREPGRPVERIVLRP